MRKNEKEFEKAMNEDILTILNIGENLSKKEKFDKIEKLQWELWDTFDKVKNEVYPDRPDVRLHDYSNFFRDKKGPFENVGIWSQGKGLVFYNCKKFSDYDLKLEIYPKDDGTTIFFKIQKEIEDKDFIKRILEKMNILNDFNKKEDCWNFYFRNLDITKNFEIKEYILNFLQKFDDFVSKI